MSEGGDALRVIEEVTAHGNRDILATNKKTFEITKEPHLTERGDCIVAVAADKSGPSLNEMFKRALRNARAKLTVIFRVGNEEEVIQAWGSPNITLSHPTDLVIRKSNFVCRRTLGIKADKTASDFSERMLKELKSSRKILIELIVDSSE